MTRFEFGDIVLVPFPFTDQSAVKKRPAVVVSSATYNTERPDVIVMAVTSRIPAHIPIGIQATTLQRSGGTSPGSGTPSKTFLNLRKSPRGRRYFLPVLKCSRSTSLRATH